MADQKSSTRVRLIKSKVEALPIPATGQAIWWDDQLTGFGLRISNRGTRTYFVHARSAAGRQIKVTLGRHGPITAEQARGAAKQFLGAIAAGQDPAAERRGARQAEKERRAAPDLSELCDRYLREHAERRKRPSSIRSDRVLINKHILPALGRVKVADVSHAQVERLHGQIGAVAPVAANRALAALSKAFALAIKWGWRGDNPCKGIERNREEPRERYLTAAEMARLAAALNKRQDQLEAACIVFAMLTGARRNELLTARWRDFADGVWTKPSAHTKQRRSHRVPLSAPACAVLATLAERHSPGPSPDAFVFGPDLIHRLRSTWEAVRAEAQLPGLRLHDLRHAYASLLVSAGLSLPIIGRLLGHTVPQTTARYAHLADDPLRQATERVGAAWQIAAGDRP